ncbi:MAG: dipeptidase [Syntrophaceticus sp.]|nr:dipeptidase [Syntrophaceticus sp.]MDD3313941.1 dipeptidase [Syntrophaceticus sp.]MDD4359019.1 dipeptidase [Syntrophaceticus sp.]MDD4782246.1 dipeptidase [Syntrophaceticus sp.]
MIIDMHCDSVLGAFQGNRKLTDRAQVGHFDLPRMQSAGVKIQFFALFPDITASLSPLRQVLILGDYFWEQYEESQEIMQLITSHQSLLQLLDSKKCGALLTVEGGEVLEGDLRMLRVLYRMGGRSLCLTWNHRNEIADGVAEMQTGGGLTLFGREVVREMNKIGMIVDVSHIAEKGFWDVLELCEAPVIASHSNSQAVWDHPRNLTDEQIKGIAQKKGVIGLNFVADFLGEQGSGLDQLLRHIDHICDLVGDDYLGFGSDFDGTDNLLAGIDDVTIYPELISFLKKRNYKDTTIRKICGENCLRVLNAVL